ncbi:MAG: biopolymer transporter ExbD [Gemmatimonadaceae bacterium]|nr:biopolymer transporter ExbD [Gemmatimonadaceae bacterium]MDQ3242380.1 biopolymer transporter ExbD [Gemmatimonadota bacterium]
MAGMAAGTSGLKNEPNVVPMIDILLVLLIIFMLVVPMSRKAIDLQLPDPTETTQSSNPPPQIVLEVLPGDKFLVNKEPITRPQLGKRLKEIYDPRPEKIIFVKGAPKGVKYSDVIFAMDVARGAGVKVIGVSPKDAQ